VKPVFDLAYRDPLGKLGTRVYSYQRGDIWIDAVLPPEATDPAIAVRPLLAWPDEKHTYDLRAGKYPGKLKAFEPEVERSSPVAVARLGYQVGSVVIDAPKSAEVAASSNTRAMCGITKASRGPGM